MSLLKHAAVSDRALFTSQGWCEFLQRDKSGKDTAPPPHSSRLLSWGTVDCLHDDTLVPSTHVC